MLIFGRLKDPTGFGLSWFGHVTFVLHRMFECFFGSFLRSMFISFLVVVMDSVKHLCWYHIIFVIRPPIFRIPFICCIFASIDNESHAVDKGYFSYRTEHDQTEHWSINQLTIRLMTTEQLSIVHEELVLQPVTSDNHFSFPLGYA